MADAVIEARQGEQMETSKDSSETSDDDDVSFEDVNVEE